MLKVQDTGVMVGCLDILAESILAKDKVLAEQLIKAAYWLCDLYQDELNKGIMGRYYLRVFEKEISD